MNQQIIKISDYTKLPGARHRTDGDNSADWFYEEYVKPIIEAACEKKLKGSIILDLDGTLGYASSFVSQIGVRIHDDFSDCRKWLNKNIEIKSNDDPIQKDIFWNEIKKR